MVEMIQVGDLKTHLCTGQGSLFEVKFAVEPLVSAD